MVLLDGLGCWGNFIIFITQLYFFFETFQFGYIAHYVIVLFIIWRFTFLSLSFFCFKYLFFGIFSVTCLSGKEFLTFMVSLSLETNCFLCHYQLSKNYDQQPIQILNISLDDAKASIQSPDEEGNWHNHGI